MLKVNVNLDTLMFRLRTDTHMLETHKGNPQHQELLNKRISRHKEDIINFLLSDTKYGVDKY